MNAEINTLIEGTLGGGNEDISELQRTLDKWHSSGNSSEPTDEWLAAYRARYCTTIDKDKIAHVRIAPLREVAATSANWLATADWSTYYSRVLEALRQSHRKAEEYHDVLDAAAAKLSVPWEVSYFDELNKRKIMGGIKPYGWLGHVAATGMFRKLLANGTNPEKQTIFNAINRIAALNHPIEWNALEAELNRLADLNFKMNVWGRLLCLVRPDLYCTVASESVRANLSSTLNVTRSEFFDPTGYIKLLKLVHSSPWFLAAKPADPAEAAIWQRRVAFMDPIFY